jgi:hypothetical protein
MLAEHQGNSQSGSSSLNVGRTPRQQSGSSSLNVGRTPRLQSGSSSLNVGSTPRQQSGSSSLNVGRTPRQQSGSSIGRIGPGKTLGGRSVGPTGGAAPTISLATASMLGTLTYSTNQSRVILQTRAHTAPQRSL